MTGEEGALERARRRVLGRRGSGGWGGEAGEN